MVSMVHPSCAAAQASGKRHLARMERRSHRWLRMLARRRERARWARGEATFRRHQREAIDLSEGPAARHTDEHVARQLELAAHNGQASRVSVFYSFWD